MPDKSVRNKKIMRGSFVNYFYQRWRYFYPVMNEAFIKRNVVIEGKEHLDNALPQGKGVLLFQAIFGAFQMTMPNTVILDTK